MNYDFNNIFAYLTLGFLLFLTFYFWVSIIIKLFNVDYKKNKFIAIVKIVVALILSIATGVYILIILFGLHKILLKYFMFYVKLVENVKSKIIVLSFIKVYLISIFFLLCLVIFFYTIDNLLISYLTIHSNINILWEIIKTFISASYFLLMLIFIRNYIKLKAQKEDVKCYFQGYFKSIKYVLPILIEFYIAYALTSLLILFFINIVIK